MLRRTVRLLPLLLLAIAVWQHAPLAASATCGDYVVWGKQSFDSAKQSAAMQSVHEVLHPICRPCQGSQCSKAPEMPVSDPAAMIITIEDDRPLVVSVEVIVCGGAGRFAMVAELRLRITAMVKEIEHPPQLI